MIQNYRIESFSSEDNKIHGIAQDQERTIYPRSEKNKTVKTLCAQGYWVEVFDAHSNELISEHSPT